LPHFCSTSGTQRRQSKQPEHPRRRIARTSAPGLRGCAKSKNIKHTKSIFTQPAEREKNIKHTACRTALTSVRMLTVDSGECRDLGAYFSEIGKEGGKKDAKPETQKRNNYDLDPKNKDGLESKWQHGANKQVDDGTGTAETTVRACVKGGYLDGTNSLSNCITCKLVPRRKHSDKCNQCQCQHAVFFST
jgi:hypothetical protein